MYDEKEEKHKFRRDVAFKDQDGDLFFDKLHFKFLQMPLFNKSENQLVTKFDKWCYFLKNLEDLDNIPAILNEPIFQKAFETAELAAMTEKQQIAYQESLIHYSDMKNMIDTAVEEAVEDRLILVAENLLKLGLSDKDIANAVGLSIQEIREIRLKSTKK